MALEIAASRFLAPYFGTSMIVWANIIGLILLSLSIGYWVGGKWADKRPDGKWIMILSLVAGIMSSFLPLWCKFLFSFLTAGIMSTPVWIIICSFFAILLVFSPPIVLLGMLNPMILRIIASERDEIGKIAGNLYACSTLGSLFGTFGTAFVTIPFLGSRETIFIWSSFLILLSAWGLRKNRQKWLVLLLILPITLYFVTNSKEKFVGGQKILWSKDSLYQYIRVTESTDGDISLVYNEGGGVQSVRRAGDSLAYEDYYNDFTMVPFLSKSSTKEILILGAAGGTTSHLIAKYSKPLLPEIHITGVELDAEVVKLGPRYFGLQPNDASIITNDARVFINNTDKRYDAIIVDCYSQQIYIPFHLSTIEFFQKVHEHLNTNGLLAMNINATNPDSLLLASLTKTVQHVFPYTYLTKVRGDYNYLLLGSTNPLDLEQLKRIPSSSPLAAVRNKWPETLIPIVKEKYSNGTILSDNHAPTEMMTDSMIFGEAKNR
nr:fused MFS/spermidine synthase [Paenibacillus sp. GSMTC-2017]